MESNANAEQQQGRIGRIAEGVLLLGGALIGIWLLWVLIFSFLK